MSEMRHPRKNKFWTAPIIAITILAVAVGIWASYSVGYRRGESSIVTGPGPDKVYTVTTESVIESMIAEAEAQRGTESYQETTSQLESVKAVVRANRESMEAAALAAADKQAETVYWVPNGKVWHTTDSCRTLARSWDIREGSIEDSGKARVCKVCG
jgi:hypothetical protein